MEIALALAALVAGLGGMEGVEDGCTTDLECHRADWVDSVRSMAERFNGYTVSYAQSAEDWAAWVKVNGVPAIYGEAE